MIAANDSIAQGASDLKAKPLARGLRLALVTAVLVAGLAARGHGQAPEPGYWERTSLPYTGLATFYAEGLMDYVQGYRLGLGQVDECPECVGAVALLRAGDIGRKVWLQAPGGEPTGPFMVVDCARRKDYPRLLARGWAVDVSYELGRLWGMDAPLGDVTVFEDPADAAAGPPAPIRAATAIAVPPGQVVITAPTSTPPPDQRMDAAASGPTPWPTRLPAARAGVASAATPTLPPPTPLWPPPLTPIITTPTPVATAASETPAPPPAEDAAAQPATIAIVQPTETPMEVAVGRAGAGFLGEPTPEVARLLLTPTRPPPPTRTPRPDLTPILPAAPAAVPTPAATPSPSLLEQIWRALLEWVQP